MGASTLSSPRRWLYALKPASWPKVLVPALLGQAMGFRAESGVSLGGLAAGLAFTVFDIVFIVLLNDWGDVAVDTLKRRMFPQAGSPKTIPDGILPARSLLLGGAVAGALALLTARAAESLLPRPGFTAAAALCLAFFVAYTLPPVRLNYRGGGELLEGVGVGALLPWLNAYGQGGDPWMPAVMLLPGFTLWAQASAIASGLADEDSDRQGGKRTVVTAFGNTFARGAILALMPLGCLALLAAPFVTGPFLGGEPVAPWVPLPAVAVALLHMGRLRRLGKAAVSRAFAAQAVYKGALHQAIWRGGLALAVSLVAAELLGSRGGVSVEALP